MGLKNILEVMGEIAPDLAKDINKQIQLIELIETD